MISRYESSLSSPTGEAIPADWAYRIYSWLLSQIPQEQGQALHSQGVHPISQYLSPGPAGTAKWSVALLDDEANELFAPILESCREIPLHSGSLQVKSVRRVGETSPKDLILSGRELDLRRVWIRFASPTSFRQAGQYVIYPQERLIVNSLVDRWNSFCPEYPMEDADAISMLAGSLRITDYSLRTLRYRLKEAYIPAFTGGIALSSSLPLPLAELWGALLRWASYSGMGIKTALGMGGIEISLPAGRRDS